MEEPTWWQKLLKLEPAVVRGLITSFAAALAVVLRTQVDEDAVKVICDFVVIVLGILSALLIRNAVTPNLKVVVRDDTPLSGNPTIVPGEATVENVDIPAVVQAATVRDAA